MNLFISIPWYENEYMALYMNKKEHFFSRESNLKIKCFSFLEIHYHTLTCLDSLIYIHMFNIINYQVHCSKPICMDAEYIEGN